MDSKNYCVLGRHKSKTFIIIEYKNVNTRTKKFSKLENENLIIVTGLKNKFLLGK